ncbi:MULTISPECIES: glycosyltransferase [Parafrankia]|uniref:glycosyltransferase n=1 Tax=Parafrankia TaxID=2994362 RepID=UPI0018679E0A|nr:MULTISPECIES: glycosyltransferase [Parafrankia]MBE3199554.1 glycosyltransferase [Parafrankia sp. CH37]
MLRADVVIVPAQSMAERVTRVVPSARERLAVLHNPVSVPRARCSPPASPRFVCPIVPGPYKMLEERLTVALEAADILAAPPHRVDIAIDVTATPAAFRRHAVVSHPRINFLGALTPTQVEDLVRGCSAILYPTELESFGYPLAEGRAMGVPVVGLDTPHNREVAGPALVPYARQVAHEVAAAMFAALAAAPAADPAPFDPGRYFARLLQRPHR